MFGSTYLLVQVGEPQQTTQNSEPLPASVQDTTSTCLLQLNGKCVDKDAHSREQNSQSETRKATTVHVSVNSSEVILDEENGEQTSHERLLPNINISRDEIPNISPSAVPRKVRKFPIPEPTVKPLSCGQPIITSECLNQMSSHEDLMFSDPTGHCTTSDSKDAPSTRHSSGCDDSGVFFDDSFLTSENATSAPTLGASPHRYVNDDCLSPDMRQYSSDTQLSVDSDAERSDDLGLPSSSVDSADDVDGDPLPSTLKIETAKEIRNPPPVPPRKFLSTAKCELSIVQEPTVFKTDTVLPKQTSVAQSMENETHNPGMKAPGAKDYLENVRWKSEECLKSVAESKWSQRHNEKSISVKDRIAMFSEMEINSTKNVLNQNQRCTIANNVTLATSCESMELKPSDAVITSKAADFPMMNSDSKWYSMHNLPVSGIKTDNSVTHLLDTKTLPHLEPKTCALSDDKLMGKKANVVENVPLMKTEPQYSCFQEKTFVSRYPQTQLTSNKRYSYGPYSINSVRTAEDLFSRKSSTSSLLSILDARKQPLAKLKGLIIPEKPVNSVSKKVLPTIVSNDSLILSTKADTDTEKTEESAVSTSAYRTLSLPRNHKEKGFIAMFENENIMSEPTENSWNSHNSIPKNISRCPITLTSASPDFANAVTNSLSPTPPSSVTSLLSPRPTSPSSICSSNASSAPSVATFQQNVFQFALSHSKPVTALLPEKPIMSPPASLFSDLEYEGDNSEDSSTSPSPMIRKGKSKDIARELLSSSFSEALNSNEARNGKSSRALDTFSNGLYDTDKDNRFSNFLQNGNTSELDAHRTNDYFTDNNDTKLPHVSKQASFHALNETNLHSYHVPGTVSDLNNSRVSRDNSSDFSVLSTEVRCSTHQNKFFPISQENTSTVFRAQPLTVKQTHADNMTDDCASFKPKKSKSVSNVVTPNTFLSDQSDASWLLNGSTLKECSGDFIAKCECDSSKCAHSSDMIYLKRKLFSSEDEDDSYSTLSHRTEDSSQTDDYFSDTTVDSFNPDLKPRRLSQQKVVLKAAVDETVSVQKFKALASKWEQGGDVKSPPPSLSSFAQKKESFGETIPTTSGIFLSLADSFSSKNTSSGSSTNNLAKLPPSLMPRQKLSTASSASTSSLSKMSKGSTNEINFIKCKQKDSQKVQETAEYDISSKMSRSSENKSFLESVYSKYPSSAKDTNFAKTSLNDSAEICNENINRDTKSNCSVYSNSLQLKTDKKYADDDGQLSEVDSGMLKSQTTLLDRKAPMTNPFDLIHRRFERMEERNTSSLDDAKQRSHSGNRNQLDLSMRSQGPDLFIMKNQWKSQGCLRDPIEKKTSMGASYLSSRNAKSLSVSDIRRVFETESSSQNKNTSSKSQLSVSSSSPKTVVESSGHIRQRVSHDNPKISEIYNKRHSSFDSVERGSRDSFSSSSSVSSSITASPGLLSSSPTANCTTNAMSSQDLQQLINDANESLKESCTDISAQQSVEVIVLRREQPSASVGITLAGGADYEVKEITVHKIIAGSIADRDGRINKGDRVISINGNILKGTTHKEALDILKTPRSNVVLVISRDKLVASDHCKLIEKGKSSRVHKEYEEDKSTFPFPKEVSSQVSENVSDSNMPLLYVELKKDSTGLGFSLEGGKDSPAGDRPLLIKRIFKGGAADKDGQLEVGDEVISINGHSLTNMTRTEAWNFLKKFPDGTVTIKSRKRVGSS